MEPLASLCKWSMPATWASSQRDGSVCCLSLTSSSLPWGLPDTEYCYRNTDTTLANDGHRSLIHFSHKEVTASSRVTVMYCGFRDLMHKAPHKAADDQP